MVHSLRCFLLPGLVSSQVEESHEVGKSYRMLNEVTLRSRTGVRASFMALTCASDGATARDAVHNALMTLAPYTRIREGEVQELGYGVLPVFKRNSGAVSPRCPCKAALFPSG
jgi:hypothetical protein